MAITIDYGNTNIINVELEDLTLVEGSLYKLNCNDFRLILKDIEDSEEGIIFPRTHNHNQPYTVSGVEYDRAFLITNNYSVRFPDLPISVILEETNTNLADVQAGILVQNQAQVIPNNSAGKSRVLDPEDIAKAVLDYLLEGDETVAESLRLIRAEAAGKLLVNGNTVAIRDKDDTKDRILATVNNSGERTDVATDAS